MYSKNYYIPYRLPIRQAKWSYAVLELGRVSKHYYIKYRRPIRQAKWSYVVLEVGRVSKKLLYNIPVSYTHLTHTTKRQV